MRLDKYMVSCGVASRRETAAAVRRGGDAAAAGAAVLFPRGIFHTELSANAADGSLSPQ